MFALIVEAPAAVLVLVIVPVLFTAPVVRLVTPVEVLLIVRLNAPVMPPVSVRLPAAPDPIWLFAARVIGPWKLPFAALLLRMTLLLLMPVPLMVSGSAAVPEAF